MSISTTLRYRLRDALSSVQLANELSDLLDSLISGITPSALLDLASTVAGKGASLIGIEAGSLGEGGPSTVQAAFAAALAGMNDKLNASKLITGSATVLAAATTVTAVVGADYNGKMVLVSPATSPGLATRWYGVVAGGTLTITVDVVPGTNTAFNYLILDL